MTEIVNLRQVRKRKARTDREAEAAANRAKHGRNKAEKAQAELAAAKLRATLDGARKDDGG
jgi:hypothetical protein